MSRFKENCEKQLKRICTELEDPGQLDAKKPRIDLAPTIEIEEESHQKTFENNKKLSLNKNVKQIESKSGDKTSASLTAPSAAPQSPKKRIELNNKISNNSPKKSQKFIYGNYSQYYGYRNKEVNSNNFHDVRLDVFAAQPEGLFQNKKLLDIGCNNGFITIEVAKRFKIHSIIGIDIDAKLIKDASKHLLRLKKPLPYDNEQRKQNLFPYNVSFVHGNYVLKNDVLLEIEKPQFDVILCLSVTKWIHLNFGDSGMKQAFRRMFLQLNNGGKLILEAQPFKTYARRKKLTDQIFGNFKSIEFFPQDFARFLLSKEVGFARMEALGAPPHCIGGFKRPILIFHKQ